MREKRIIAGMEIVFFRYDYEIIFELVLFRSLRLLFRIERAVSAITYARARTVTVGMHESNVK